MPFPIFYMLSCTLIIYCAQRFRRTIMLREKYEQHERQHIWQYHHKILITGRHRHYLHELITAGTGKTKQQAGTQCRQNAPVSEYQRGDSQITVSNIYRA